MSNLRVLEQYFGVELPETSSVTVAGVIQECLQRLPVVGDQCVWGPFEMEVTEAPDDGPDHRPSTTRCGDGGRVVIAAGLLFLIGVLLSAFFSGCETGFYRATRVRMQLDAMSGDRIARA